MAAPALSTDHAARLAQLFALARTNVNAFVTAVMRDESTGFGLAQAPIHKAWHQLASAHDRLLVWSAIEHGKTTQLSVARTLWELGTDPTLRVAVVSNTHSQAEKIVRTVARSIERSRELHAIFPNLRKGDLWTSTKLTVRRPFVSKDPSVQAFGIHGNITGARVDRLIMDDVLDYENTRTSKMRQDLWDWYHAALEGRLTERGRVLVVGTAFHPDDLLHRLAKAPGWQAVRYPVVDDVTGLPRWPERWPPKRIEEKRIRLGPLEFARQLLCVARDDGESRFKREWIELGLRRGVGKNLCFGLSELPPGIRTFTGVDLAVQQKDGADLTVLFSIAVHPNGDREVLNVDAGRWSGPEIVGRLIEAHRRYLSICVVENNAAQDFILQFARGASAIPMRAFTTGRNKAHPEFGVESLAAEMAGGKWIIPSGKDGNSPHPEVRAWIEEMLFYDPRNHTGDRLMGSWFAREGARLGSMRVEGTRLDIASR